MSSDDCTSCAEIETFRIKKKFLLKWIINDFPCEEVKGGETLPSTKFQFSFDPDTEFKGQLSLVDNPCSERKCLLELNSLTLDSWSVWADISFGDDMIESSGAALSNDSNKATWNLWSPRTFCMLSKSFEFDNAIKITCTISYVTYTEDELPSLPALPDKNDNAELFETKEGADVTLVVKGTEIPAHKSILAKRSTVFAQLFEENDSNRICINDIKVKVMQELLRFIYTGKVVEVTLDLLIISYTYDMPDLRLLCQNKLIYKITTKTAAKILMYGDKYRDPRLKAHAIRYIQDNLEGVTSTYSWRKLVQKHSYLIAEIFDDMK